MNRKQVTFKLGKGWRKEDNGDSVQGDGGKMRMLGGKKAKSRVMRLKKKGIGTA